MPKFGYSAEFDEPYARAMGKEMRISPKHAMEVCRAIRGMRLEAAKEYLEAVMAGKRAVPFKRHRKKLAHRRAIQGWDAGQYPAKASKAILEVLENLEANAKYKGLDPENAQIVHASAHKGIVIPGFKPRAFGRAAPFNKPTTNVEIVVKGAKAATGGTA